MAGQGLPCKLTHFWGHAQGKLPCPVCSAILEVVLRADCSGKTRLSCSPNHSSDVPLGQITLKEEA